MRIAVVGLGSMGRRRLRLLSEIVPAASLVGIDSRSDRRDAVVQAMPAVAVEDSLEQAGAIDAIFVCTPPGTHAQLILAALRNHCHVFTELNLMIDGYSEMRELAGRQGVVLYPSATFLKRAELRYVTRRVAERPAAYNYSVGQYLPDWHPWEPYDRFFVANKATNACRELLSIELPWLIRAFGPISGVAAHATRLSGLKIDYPDVLQLHLTHEGGSCGQLGIDVVSRVARRHLTVVREDLYLQWAGTPDSLSDWRSGRLEPVRLTDSATHDPDYDAMIIEDAYAAEVRDFLACIETGAAPEYTLDDDLSALSWVDRIEEQYL